MIFPPPTAGGEGEGGKGKKGEEIHLCNRFPMFPKEGHQRLARGGEKKKEGKRLSPIFFFNDHTEDQFLDRLGGG